MEDKKYWSRLEQRNANPETQATTDQEFPGGDPFEQAAQPEVLRTSRRNFLKILGFGIGSAATMAACTQTPVKYALPYVNKPVELMPTIADYYASTYYDGLDYNSILVKTREGRPIKIEGNPTSTVTPAGTSVRAQASVLSMYDNHRLRQPMAGKAAKNWDEIHQAVRTALEAAAGRGGNIRIVSNTIISPSTRALIAEFTEKYNGTRFVEYDPISFSGMLEAHEKGFGKRAIPQYRFDQADLVVSFGADFLATWLSPTEFTSQWASRRKFKDSPTSMSRLICFESVLSLTGSNADTRIPIKPSQEGGMLVKLHDEIASATGGMSLGGGGLEAPGNYISAIAQELLAKRGSSIVISGSNDPEIQIAVASINEMLGNYGMTMLMSRPCLLRRGSDDAIAELSREMGSGQVEVLICINCNPVHDLPNGKSFGEDLKKVGTSVAHVVAPNETSSLCKFSLATNHYLESWGDAEPYTGSFSVQQPTINPLFNTMQYQECLMHFMGIKGSYLDYMRTAWQGKLNGGAGNYEENWKQFLHDGVSVNAPAAATAAPAMNRGELGGIGSSLSSRYSGNKGKTDLVLYIKTGIGTGSGTDNPWLQELPDPITKATWDNYITVPVRMAEAQGIENGDILKISAGSHTVELPAFILPGQQAETIGIAVGYGRTVAGLAGMTGETPETGLYLGGNAYPFAQVEGGNILFFNSPKIDKTGGNHPLAISQVHGTIMGRNIVRETTVPEYNTFVNDYQEEREKLLHHLVSLYPKFKSPGHHWAMSIDLNACTGCGACVVACNAENNIPVVGREEVRRGRELHWIRIDRYFSDNTTADGQGDMEMPAEYPDVVFQPMLCQHCDDAPCENVCPVLATVHSNEGMNQQAYNRCFGTRYCANNCPYKVRRFNWLDYTDHETFTYNPVDDLGRMVLNPDVTVRARGVMEKCSFCAQRIQAAKLEAKKAGKPLPDGAIKPACAQACPAGAISFGDINNPDALVSSQYPKHSPFEYTPARKGNDRAFFVIEEVKTRPSVAYLIKVRNRKPMAAAKA